NGRPDPFWRWPIQFGTSSRHTPKDNDDSWTVGLTISHWLLVILLFMMPALWIRRLRHTRRGRRLGLCFACGYDLRSTPARCPECGAVPEQITATARRRDVKETVH